MNGVGQLKDFMPVLLSMLEAELRVATVDSGQRSG
jgi:hypothetical protein